MAPDLLSTIRREIDERLKELRPLLAERERLLDAVAALEVADSTAGDVNGLQRPAGRESIDSGSPTRLAAKTGSAARPSRPAARASRPVAAPKPERAARSAGREAILAALGHGSHTVGELAVVTAMSGPSINGNLRKLVSEGAVVKTEREGKAAWALAAAA